MTDTQTWPAPSATPPPPPPAKKSHKKLWIGLGIFALLWAIGSAMGTSDSNSTSNSTSDSSDSTPSTGIKSTNSGAHAAADDVDISTCADSAIASLPDVQVEITNHTSKRSNYMVEITLLDSSGNKVGDGTAISNNVEAGQTATEDALATVASGQSFTKCRIASVSRYAS